MSEQKLEVFGVLIQGYAQACLNLNIVAGKRATDFINNIDIMKWYPLEKWTELEKMVIASYKNYDPILLRVGIEMMNGWYHFGPGKDIIKRGVDFLHFQTGSQGYVSVVKGSKEEVGDFHLESIDEKKGKAVVYSTTPFNRKMECGVLIGGMLAPGDLDYVDVINDNNPDYLEVEFH